MAEIIAAAQTALDQLKQALAALSAVPGVLGHNGLVAGVTPKAIAEVTTEVEGLQVALDATVQDPEEIRSKWQRIWRWVGGFVRPAFKLIEEGALREAGKEFWDQAHSIYLTWGVGQNAGAWLWRLLDIWTNGGS